MLRQCKQFRRFSYTSDGRSRAPRGRARQIPLTEWGERPILAATTSQMDRPDSSYTGRWSKARISPMVTAITEFRKRYSSGLRPRFDGLDRIPKATSSTQSSSGGTHSNHERSLFRSSAMSTMTASHASGFRSANTNHSAHTREGPCRTSHLPLRVAMVFGSHEVPFLIMNSMKSNSFSSASASVLGLPAARLRSSSKRRSFSSTSRSPSYRRSSLPRGRRMPPAHSPRCLLATRPARRRPSATSPRPAPPFAGVARFSLGNVPCPRLHHLAPPLQQVRARVGTLHLIPDHVR